MQQSVSQGFVLVIVLVFLQLLSLFGIHQWMYIADFMKQSQHVWLKEQYLRFGKMILHNLEKNIPSDLSACLISVIPTSVLLIEKPVWWERYACHDLFQDTHYYYVVEALNSEGCGEIQDQYNQKTIAKYYRITINVIMDRLKGASLFLQSTVATSGGMDDCKGRRYQVIAGRQMVREW